MERRRTGNSRLDEILRGGLPSNSVTLVTGVPGSGKTMLAEQFLFANSTRERPGLYLSTVSEPLDKLLRYGQAQSFFAGHEVGRSVFYEDLGSVLIDSGLSGVLDQIDALVKEHRPSVLVIDSFKALRTFADDERDYRRFLHLITGRLTARAVTSLFVGEYDMDELASVPEFAVADAVIHLATKATAERVIRYLSIPKLRGSGHASGEHAYRLSNDGLVLFPRLADRDFGPVPAMGSRTLSTGIAALDSALGDGYRPGSTTFAVGPSGSGKTVMGVQFLYAGAAAGEAGLLVALQETRAQLNRTIAGFGWNSENPAVTVFACSPVDVLIDEIAYEILDLVAEHGVRRLVIDSLNDLEQSAPDEARFREFVVSLTRRLQHAAVSTLFIREIPTLFRLERMGEKDMLHLADNVVLLQHVPLGAALHRSLTVLKTRGAASDRSIHELHITGKGLELGELLMPQVS